jgi:hypothetical protein
MGAEGAELDGVKAEVKYALSAGRADGKQSFPMRMRALG